MFPGSCWTAGVRSSSGGGTIIFIFCERDGQWEKGCHNSRVMRKQVVRRAKPTLGMGCSSIALRDGSLRESSWKPTEQRKRSRLVAEKLRLEWKALSAVCWWPRSAKQPLGTHFHHAKQKGKRHIDQDHFFQVLLVVPHWLQCSRPFRGHVPHCTVE